MKYLENGSPVSLAYHGATVTAGSLLGTDKICEYLHNDPSALNCSNQFQAKKTPITKDYACATSSLGQGGGGLFPNVFVGDGTFFTCAKALNIDVSVAPQGQHTACSSNQRQLYYAYYTGKIVGQKRVGNMSWYCCADLEQTRKVESYRSCSNVNYVNEKDLPVDISKLIIECVPDGSCQDGRTTKTLIYYSSKDGKTIPISDKSCSYPITVPGVSGIGTAKGDCCVTGLKQ